MVHIEFESLSKLTDKFEQLQHQMDELHRSWPRELDAWQREDMHRRFPHVTVSEAPPNLRAMTEVHPGGHHQRGMNARPAFYRARQTQPKIHLPKSVMGRRPAGVRRPIVRLELLRKLYARMTLLAHKAIKWP